METHYEITLKGMRFHARVGILPHERELPQPIEVDLAVAPRAPRGAPAEGMLLDYRVLYDIVARTVQAGPIDFLEGLALAVAERTMDSGSVTSVRVAVRKPHVPLSGPLEYAEVSVELSKNED